MLEEFAYIKVVEQIKVHSTFNITELRSKFSEKGEQGEPQTLEKGSHVSELEDEASEDNKTSKVVGLNAII